jgi:hypothetical protein
MALGGMEYWLRLTAHEAFSAFLSSMLIASAKV